MLTIGLTGQSGGGKGVFSRIACKGEKTAWLDTDLTARQVVEKGSECLIELCRQFGEEILFDDGTLNRKALAGLCFGNKENNARLNEITHLYIIKEIKKWLIRAQNQGFLIAIVDAPLLFESGCDKLCDVTVGVLCPYDIRLDRIMARDGLDEESARRRLNSRPDDEFFIQKCDYVIYNDSSLCEFEEKVKHILCQIKERYLPLKG